MWQTQDERKLLLFVQLFQQWLQVAAATLHLEGLEEQKRREKEDYLRRHPYSVSRLRTVCVLSPYYIRTLYADSADICTLIWSADRVRTPWTEYGGWRRQYGESTEPVRNDFIRSIRET